MTFGITAAGLGTALGIGASALAIRSGIRGGRDGGGGGGNADPFGQYRGQFGSQLSRMFGQTQRRGPSSQRRGAGAAMLGPDGQPMLNPDGTPMMDQGALMTNPDGTPMMDEGALMTNPDGSPIYDDNTPEWMRPGFGLDMGGGLDPGTGLPVGGEGMPVGGEGMADPSMLNFNPAEITNDPAYQFQMRSGMAGLNNAAAAQGELNSGGAMAEAVQFGQGLGTSFTNQQFQRNMGRFGAMNQAQGQRFGQQFNAQNAQFGQRMGVQGARFGQGLSALQARNNAQGQRFGQGNQYANFLANMAGATQSPAAGSAANENSTQGNYNRQTDRFGTALYGANSLVDSWRRYSGGAYPDAASERRG